MYPFVRMVKEGWKFRKASALSLTDTHVSHHICWPWDLDMWVELNNGRTLTLYDLGRIPMAVRTGLIDVLRGNRWGITVAGNTVRYRRRVRAFDPVSYTHLDVYKRQGRIAPPLLLKRRELHRERRVHLDPDAEQQKRLLEGR